MSNNIDNLLSDIYSSESQSQGVKELANLINNLSSLLLKAISQLETRVAKLEQQTGRPSSQTPPPPPSTRAPAPKASSPFGAPKAPTRTPPPPPPQKQATTSPAPTSTGGGPKSIAEAASMLGATLKPAPQKENTPTASTSPANSSGPSFLTGTVSNSETASPAGQETAPTATPDAVAPTPSGGGAGIAGPAGGFKGELAEKLARRRQKVQQQLEDDYEAPDLATTPEEGEHFVEAEESTSSELKGDLEDELRNAFSKLKG